MGRSMSEGITRGARDGGRAIERMADDARAAYKRVGDATDELREQENQLKQMRADGARGVEVQAERVRRARRAEKEAIKDATDALEEYERAARGAGDAGQQAGGSMLSGLRSAIPGAAGAGQDTADSFLSGFAGASALTRLASATGPIGAALAGIGALGFMSGKVLVDNIAAGMETQATRDLFQARLGVDDATMRQYGESAASAFTNAWGASVEDNLRAVQFAVQGGVIAPDASNAEIEQTISQMQALAQIMEVDVQEAARATGQLMRGGFASSGEEAADIIAAGFQNGLDIAGDWLDTITEYTTQFRKLGLDGSDALGLIQQGLQGGARDSDKVADSLKEFSIRAVDGSALTAEGFAALGFQADDMAQRFLAGGESARSAFGATLQAIRSLDDPIQQALTWQALFGTQWEDMGDAINSMDLSTARSEFGDTEGAISNATDTLSEHVNEWDRLGRKADDTFRKIKEWLADSAIGKFFGESMPRFLGDTFFPDPGPAPTDDTGLRVDDPTPRDPNPLGPSSPSSLLIPGAPSGAPAPSAPSGGREPGWGGPTPGGPGGGTGNPLLDILQSGPGAPPPSNAPVPGARTPILTDTQQQALDEATGGSSESLPPAPVLPLEYTNTAGMPTAIASATTRLDEALHDEEEKKARLNQLRQTNVATAEDIQKAENALAQSEQRRQQAERSLQDAKTNQVEQMIKESERFGNRLQDSADSLAQIGAQLDSDFGVSDGLAGIAENITKFVGNLALAAASGPLRAQQMAMGYAPGETGGGLVGIASQMGAFGSQYQVAPSWARGSTRGGDGAYLPTSSSYGLPTLGGGTPYQGVPIGTSGDVTNQPGLDLLRSMGLKGTTYASHTTDGAPTDREIDVTDPTGGNGLARLAEFARQNPQLFEEFIYSDPVTGQKTGIRSGQLVGPGTSQPQYYASNWGGHQDHAHIEPAKGGGLSFGDGPDGGPSWNADWNTMAQLEASGNWQANTGNGYYGGLQFLPSSWQAAGGTQYAPRADLASPHQQAMTAERLLSMQGPGAWPNTFTPGNAGPGIPPGGQAAPSQSVMGGRAWGQGLPASGGASFGGGLIGAAMSTAAGAAGAAGSFGAGGGAASAAMDLGMQVAGRAIGAAGQYVGNVAGGLLETFSLNDSALGDPSASWLGRILGAATGVRPALPNIAGEMGGEQNPNMAEGGKQQPGPLTPEQAEMAEKAKAAGAKAEGGQGDTYNINTTVNRANEDQTGRVVADHLSAQQSAKQPR